MPPIPFILKQDDTTGKIPAAPSVANVNSAASTNAISVKASPGTIHAFNCSNLGVIARYVKIYNKASAPVVGTDIPVMTLPLAANQFLSLNTGPLGLFFSSGIALAITGAAVDTDATAVALGDVKVMMSYI